jgi:hypothetical protein
MVSARTDTAMAADQHGPKLDPADLAETLLSLLVAPPAVHVTRIDIGLIADA